MTQTLISYAQNGEDIVLWRALRGVENGTYLDIGANDPEVDSVSRLFYEAGWSGVAVEPNPAFASKFRRDRPRDVVFEAVVSDSIQSTATLHVVDDTGLSTIVDAFGEAYSSEGMSVHDITVDTISLDHAIEQAGLDDGRDLHFLSVDTEGAEAAVLASIDFTRFRPWILVIEATAPRSTTKTHDTWESLVTTAGYTFCYFDGLSRFYVSDEKRDELAELLSYPASVLDDFVTAERRAAGQALSETNARAGRLEDENDRLRDELSVRDARIAELTRRMHDLEEHAAALTRTVSWRVTKPLRAVRSRMRR